METSSSYVSPAQESKLPELEGRSGFQLSANGNAITLIRVDADSFTHSFKIQNMNFGGNFWEHFLHLTAIKWKTFFPEP